MVKKHIKNIWKKLPPLVHALAISFMCLIRIGRKKNAVPLAGRDAPLYIIGCFQAGGGLSQSAQLYAKECKKLFPNVICVDSSYEVFQSIKNPITDGSIVFLQDILARSENATVVIHHNPPQFQYVICALGKKFIRNKHIIAYWAWELEDIPSLWKHAMNYVDTIEVPSTFTQKAIAKNTNKTVRIKPHVLPQPREIKNTYCMDGILRCLFIMDMGALRMRKNPEAVIHAFVKAFTCHEAHLTLKLAQTNEFAKDYEKILQAAKGHTHIQILTHWMDSSTLEKTYLEHDVYISLHRSEGYGLTIHEAMQKKLIVVATGWSGNMDFMQGENVYAVDYTLVPIMQNGTHTYPLRHGQWAEANTDHAAVILQEIRNRFM